MDGCCIGWEGEGEGRLGFLCWWGRGGDNTRTSFPKDFSRSSTDFLYSASASSYFPIIIIIGEREEGWELCTMFEVDPCKLVAGR